MRRFRLFPGLALAAVLVSLGCRAQTPPPAGAELARRIEIQVRSTLNLPEEYSIAVGQRTRSEFPGYDQLPITFSKGQASRTLTFLISNDNKQLIRFDKIDLTKDPASGVDIAGRPYRGGKDAKVTIVVFDDLECPFCSRMHRELFPQTIARYGDKIKIVYKDYPLPAEMHPWAMHAAVDSACLASQNSDAYWNYVDFIHDHHSEMTGDAKATPAEQVARANETLDRLAREEGKKSKANEKKLDACISAQDTKSVVSSMHEGDIVGVEGTPLLLVNGEKINGWVDTDVLWPVIDRALKDAGVPGPPPAMPAPANAEASGVRGQ